MDIEEVNFKKLFAYASDMVDADRAEDERLTGGIPAIEWRGKKEYREPPLPDYPEELRSLTGLLGELQFFIHNRMIYPSTHTAGFLALATMTAFVQSKMIIRSRDGLGFNEQYLLLAPTGFGKEEARNPLRLLHEATGDGTSPTIHWAAPPSAQGIHQCLEHDNSVYFLADEFADWLKSSHTDGHRSLALNYVMQCYSKALSVTHPGRAASANYEDVLNPRLSILATSTGEAIYQAMSRGQAESGAYNRFVIFQGDTELPKKKYEGQVWTPESALIDDVRALRNREGEVTYSPSGYKRYIELDEQYAEPVKRSDAVIGGRLSEQAIKMAGLFALSADRDVIEPEDLELGFRIRVGLYRRAKAAVDGSGNLKGEHSTVKAMNQLVAAVNRKGEIYESQLHTYSRAYEALSIPERRWVVLELVGNGGCLRQGKKIVRGEA